MAIMRERQIEFRGGWRSRSMKCSQFKATSKVCVGIEQVRMDVLRIAVETIRTELSELGDCDVERFLM